MTSNKMSSNPVISPYMLKRTLIAVFTAFVILVSLSVGIATYVGWSLTHPAHRPLTENPGDLKLSYGKISFPSAQDNLLLQGWWLPAKQPSDKTIIFAHGYGRNRLQDDVPALPIAKGLVESGYNVLMFDFRNSGESQGNLTSIGQFEQRDLKGAIDYVTQKFPQHKIGLLGFSAGASTSLIVAANNPSVKAVVADSPFADLPTYLKTNLSKWSGLPRFPFTNIILTVIPPLTGLNPEEVRPVAVMPKLAKRPILFIHGTADRKISAEDSKLLNSKLPPGQDRVWLVPGADHVDSFSVNNKAYIAKITKFYEDAFSKYPLSIN